MSTPDWDQRQLCSDGGCVGVIGPTGTCKVCGRAAQNWGDERRRGLKTTGEHAADDSTPLPPPDPGDGDGDDPRPAGWSERRLCANGACIGLLDERGRCKVCGTVDESVPPASLAGRDDDDDDEDDEEDEEDDEAAAAQSPDDGGDEDDEDDDDEEDEEDDDLGERKLCPDGACVGVIGADNRCKLCGKDAA